MEMDTAIFKQDLSINAVSAYILVCALISEEARPALSALQARWNASPGDLETALSELMTHNVLTTRPDSPETDPVYQVHPAFRWGEQPPWPAPKGLPVFPR